MVPIDFSKSIINLQKRIKNIDSSKKNLQLLNWFTKQINSLHIG